MVARSKVVETNSVCSCGFGDSTIAQKNYFENTCPACGNEGTLQLETMTNFEQSNHLEEGSDESNNSDESQNISYKIVCKNCGSEYCGQDGFDLSGGTRACLTAVNPNEITEDEDEEVSEGEDEETTYMSGWEGLCDLLRPLDAQAMMVQRGDFVIIKKIEMPQSAKLWAYEGINVVDDSVSITDYTPEIYNTFIIKWGETYENELEFVINNHKRLFGERKVVLEAKKVQPIEEEEESEEDKEENKSWSVTDWIFGSNNDKDKKTDGKNVDLSNPDASLDGTGEEEEDNTEEVPITNRDEAIQFGLTEVGKAKRKDGHTIELKVIGNQHWQMGEWCHVKLPSFNEDTYMFISKCSFESSPDSEYINSLTLVDYPPTLGKPMKKDKEENSEEDKKEEENVEDSANGENGTDASQDGGNTGSDSNTGNGQQ